jgi:short-subunit dehydrogenase
VSARSLADRTVVVTGAATGIGAAVAAALAREGARLALADVRGDALRRTVTTVANGGRRVIGMVADVRVLETLEALRDQAALTFGRIDAVINCAGVVIPGPVDSLPVEDLRRQIDTNLLGTVLVTRTFLPYFRNRGGGHLVHVGSLGGIVPMPLEATYCATKFAVRGFCLALALEMRGTPIAVSVICPDSTDTAQLATEAAGRGSPMSFLSAPLNPSDVARAIVATLRRPRVEVVVPRGREAPSKLLGCSPGLLGVLYPLLERWGAVRLERFISQARRNADAVPTGASESAP